VVAVKALIAERLNINIMPIFSMGYYEAVAAAYIDANRQKWLPW
jgi:hypothetical protein